MTEATVVTFFSSMHTDFICFRTTLLKQLTEDLNLCNVRNVILRLKHLPIFDKFQSAQGSLDLSWLNNWTGYESPLSLPQLTSLANALNIIYHKMKHETLNNDGGTIDLVIVANGSVGAPTVSSDVTFPVFTKTATILSKVMFSTDHLKSVTFYTPWGSQIDASTFYGIITGNIKPDQTRFLGRSNDGLPKALSHFNSLNAESDETIPTVWCNAFEEKDPALEQLTLLIECGGREPKRPFIWWRQGSIPSFMLAALTSLAAMMLSDTRKRVEVSLHHGQCLVWPSTSTEPPLELKEICQYYNSVNETYRKPRRLSITPQF